MVRRLGQTACKPGSVPRRQPGRWPFIWDARCRAPRATYPGGGAETRLAGAGPRWTRRSAGRPYSVLLPVGFALPSPSPGTRCALTAPFHPYRRKAHPWMAGAGGLLSVALSLRSPSPGVTRHRVSVEPGLSSPVAGEPDTTAAIRPSDPGFTYAPTAPASSWASSECRRAAVSPSGSPVTAAGRKWR